MAQRHSRRGIRPEQVPEVFREHHLPSVIRENNLAESPARPTIPKVVEFERVVDGGGGMHHDIVALLHRNDRCRSDDPNRRFDRLRLVRERIAIADLNSEHGFSFLVEDR
jgi:hypothetical protein